MSACSAGFGWSASERRAIFTYLVERQSPLVFGVAGAVVPPASAMGSAPSGGASFA